MSRTAIQRGTLLQIRRGTVEKREILRQLAEGERDREALRRGMPSVLVTVEGLPHAERAKYDAPPLRVDGLAHGTVIARGWQTRIVAAAYEHIAEVPLYALADVDRLDVVRIGRASGQDVEIPDHGENARVSREHGLVILDGKEVLYCDYGTLRDDGTRTGSTNGTYLEDGERIKDAMITWPYGEQLMFGRRYSDRDGNVVFAFRMRYAYDGN